VYRNECISLFPIKCFTRQSTGSKVLRDLSVSSPRFPFSSRAPLYTRFVCVYLCFPPCRFYSPSPPNCSQHWSILPLSHFLQFISSIPSCRVHNCITERLSSRPTLSTPSHFPPRPLHICRSPEQNCINCSYLQRNRTKNTTEVDFKWSDKACSNRRIS